LHYLRENHLFSDLQVFNLSILPGTASRQEAAELGLQFQPRPPYYVLRTPTLSREDLYGLMQEAQELFGLEFDAQPAPLLESRAIGPWMSHWQVDLDEGASCPPGPATRWTQAFTLWLRAGDWECSRDRAVACIRQVLEDNPFTTLQVVLEPKQ